jgi:NAD(P)-dependent dehydrogenase (short-subunit alcohol dehydrogenase family)
MTPKAWFITGTSTGLGREWALAALERGDLVAGTAREAGRLSDLVEAHGERMLAVPLEITDRAAVIDAVARAHARFGRLDIVINNAGYGHLAAVEEVSEELARHQFDTNFFGALWVTQAAIPFLRNQGGGHILQVSSVAGVRAVPMLGLYSASKWALEGMTEALAGEVKSFGINVTLIEPGGYRTAQATRPRPSVTQIGAYEPMRNEYFQRGGGNLQGDPAATRAAILALVDAEEPPLRVLLGDELLPSIEACYQERVQTWRRWEPISIAAQGMPAT